MKKFIVNRDGLLAESEIGHLIRLEDFEKTIEALVQKLRQRADWLRSEYLNGGNYEHLKAREDECRYLVTLLELMPR